VGLFDALRAIGAAWGGTAVASTRYAVGTDLSVYAGGAYTSFGEPDNEKIQPGYLNAVTAYNSSAIVFGAIHARLSLFSEAEFKFQRLTDKSLFGNTDLTVLENPWPDGATGDLLARMEQDASHAGNAFIRNAGPQLERLRPDWTTIVSELVTEPRTDTQYRRVLGVWYDPNGMDGTRKADFYPVEEVAHWAPIPDPLAAFRGMSWLTPVLREIDADTQMTDYKRAYLTNAATPNLLIKYSRKIAQASLDRLSAQLEARHGGVNNAFRTLILDEGADVTPIGHTFEQMAYAATQAAGENRIMVASGVPAIVAGVQAGLDAATYSNYGMAMRRFADITMRPNWRSACAALSKLVAVPGGCRLWFDTSAIAALQEGEKERADTMAVLAAAAMSLVAGGWTKDSIKAALAASDVTLLQDSGMTSVQLQTPGEAAVSGKVLKALPPAASDQGGTAA
jgi:phage portal protein BeeE